MPRLRVAASVLVAMAFVPQAASAGENGVFGAEPFPAISAGDARRSFDMPAGGTFTDSVRLYNMTREPVRLALYVASASIGSDDVVAVGFREPRPTGLASAITLARSNVDLAPGKDTIVTFAVQMRGASAGALAAIVAEGMSVAGSADLDLVQRIAILVRPSHDGVGNGAVPTRERGSGALRTLSLIMVSIVGSAWFRARRRARRARLPEAMISEAPVSR